MKLAVNLDTLRVHATPTNPAPLQLVEFTRGDHVPLEIVFFRSGGVTPLETNSALRVGVKTLNDFAGDFLAAQTAWDVEEDTYSALLNCNTVEAAAALGASAALDAALEIAWDEGGGEITARAVPAKFHNDYIRGDEGIPTDAGPAAPIVTVLDDAPAHVTDFFMFPGGVAPTSGLYQATDEDYIYTIKGGWSAWKRAPLAEWE